MDWNKSSVVSNVLQSIYIKLSSSSISDIGSESIYFMEAEPGTLQTAKRLQHI